MSLSTTLFNILEVKNPQQLYLINKSKKEYLIPHKECAICGSVDNLEVHHVIPVHINIILSTQAKNFVTLCDFGNSGCHRRFGHFGDFKNLWNLSIREYAIASRLFLHKMQPERAFVVLTSTLIEEYAEAMDLTTVKFLEKVNSFNK